MCGMIRRIAIVTLTIGAAACAAGWFLSLVDIGFTYFDGDSTGCDVYSGALQCYRLNPGDDRAGWWEGPWDDDRKN